MLDARSAPFIDITATDMLTQLADDPARRHVTLGSRIRSGRRATCCAEPPIKRGVAVALYPDVDRAVAAAHHGDGGPDDR